MAWEADRVRSLVTSLAAGRDVDVIDVGVRGRGPGRVVRVVVDRKGGVDLATCRDLSRALSQALDATDELEGTYVLEVSSPGVDHPLRDRAAFDRVEGRAVLVHRRTEDDRSEELRGTVVRAEQDAVVLAAAGREVRVAYGEIVSAKQTLPW
jgi:ribosome maturation factor RimP